MHGLNMTTTTLISQLEALFRRVEAMRDKIQTAQIRPAKSQLEKFETLAIKLTEAATKVSEEIRALTNAHTKRPSEQGSNLVSQAQSSRESVANGQLNLAILRRNLTLIFEGPKDSALDSSQIKARKKVIRERCKTICGLDPDTVLMWAVAFAPTVWTAGTMSTDTFDYLVEELDSEESHTWPSDMYKVLHTLGAEEPLRGCNAYHDFVKGLDVLNGSKLERLTSD